VSAPESGKDLGTLGFPLIRRPTLGRSFRFAGSKSPMGVGRGLRKACWPGRGIGSGVGHRVGGDDGAGGSVGRSGFGDLDKHSCTVGPAFEADHLRIDAVRDDLDACCGCVEVGNDLNARDGHDEVVDLDARDLDAREWRDQVAAD
jgi:hypothetical protein